MRLRLAELDEPVAEVDGGVRLAAAGCHLDQRTGRLAASDASRFFMLSNCTRHRCAASSSGGISRSMRPNLLVELDESDQLIGPMEGEDVTAAGVGFEAIRELRYLAGGFVCEGERQAVMRKTSPVGRQGYLPDWVSTPVSVWPSGFASTTPDGLGVGVQHVVGEPRPERKLPNGHAHARQMFMFCGSGGSSRKQQAACRSPPGLFVLGSSPLVAPVAHTVSFRMELRSSWVLLCIRAQVGRQAV